MALWEKIKELYWKNDVLNERQKEKVFYFVRGLLRGKEQGKHNLDVLSNYVDSILKNQGLSNAFSINFPQEIFVNLTQDDPKLIAYYLPQFYPTKQNDEWWGKGSTEWTNVSKSVPQYLGQYQPRLPGELGFYDLRVQENIYRQIELAKIYGIYGFCFYYYWFDGLRLLDLPFRNFVNDESIDFPFCICWCNESWTKQWSGASNTILVEQRNTVESYKDFIVSCYELFEKKNYICVNGKPLLNVYKPNNIPQAEVVLKYWRNFIKEHLGKDLYIVATIGHHNDYGNDYLAMGFDAVSEFSPGPHINSMDDVTSHKEYVCKEFLGNVYDYKSFVLEKRYFKNTSNKLFRALCPMWDNTARKMNKGLVLDGATPELYKTWLKDVIIETKNNKDLDDKLVFINAWNEWAEGTYLEPDLKWQYKYLEATKDAILETRGK